MKKRNLVLGLVAFMLGGMTLTSCDPVSKKADAILTINNGSDKAKEINVNDIFNKYITKSTGITSYYDALCEVVIRASIEVTDEIKNTAEQNVNQQKDKARSNAETNKTTYDEELDKILKDNGVENLNELKDKFIYDQLKSKARDKYFKDNEANGYKLLREYINEKLPYHVSHMLINVSASDTDGGYKGQITEQEAINLTGAIKRLSRGDTFGSVAQSLSGDSSSASNYGEGDIVTLDSSYVNEFKLGIYAFDNIYNSKAKDARAENINMSTYAADYYASKTNMDKISYEQIMKMSELVSLTKDSNGIKVNDGDENYYPRNVYFNNLFNSHRIALITAPKTYVEANNLVGFKAADADNGLGNVLGTDEYALCTTTGKPILVVRSGSGDSYQGIFFMVIEKSAITETSDTLAAYYDYKKSNDEYNSSIGTMYVNFNEKSNLEYNKRKEKIKSAVESYDKLIDNSIFKYYFNLVPGRFTFNDEIKYDIPEYGTITLEDAINKYIDNTEFYYDYTNKNTMNQTWTEFVEKLEVIEDNESRRINLDCADAFADASTSSLYAVGGACRVKTIK